MTRPSILSATSIIGDKVVNHQGDALGKIEEVMLDVDDNRIAYAVLSFGGFLGIGDKYFAVPWEALRLDANNKRFVLNESKERLENAPGFDKDDWPDMADRTFGASIYDYYKVPTYWQ
ncbi:MAG: PRC-barrel domain-containing protein [Myxococcales bacterium]|nr:PRC-barrel domain-containing protein [Myxococcales bacterium]